MKISCLIVITTTFFQLGLHGQSENSLILEGKVLDGHSQVAIANAYVTLDNNRIGTVTNSQGAFRLILPSQYADDSIRISYIGYISQRYPIAEVTTPLQVVLKEDTQLLEAVVIRDYTAKSLILEAMGKIASNYYQQGYHSKGFYRLISKKKSDIVRISEAVFDLYHARPTKGNQFKLEKVRAIKDQQALKNINVGLKPQSVLRFDLINALSAWELLSKKGLKKHEFEIEGEVLYDNNPVYVISFSRKKDLKETGYQGKLYIDKNTLAFVYFDFAISGIPYHKYGNLAFRTKLKVLGFDLQMKQERFEIFYRKLGDRFYMSQATISHDLTVSVNRSQDQYLLQNAVNYLVTDIQLENNIPHTSDEVLSGNKLIEKRDSFKDPNFWKEHNIVLPGFDFDAIAERISIKNEQFAEEQ